MSLLQAYLRNPRTRSILSRKPGEKGFSLIELVVVIAVLAVLIVVALPNFQGVTDDAAASSGKKYLADAVTECTVARTRGITDKKITPPTINGGSFAPEGETACPTSSGTLLKFTPSEESIPDFSVDLYNGAKTCGTAQKGTDGQYGCKSSKW